MLISQTRSENPRNLIFYKHGSRKYRRTSGFKAQNFSDLFPVIDDLLFFSNNSAPTEIFNVLKVIPALRTARTSPFSSIASSNFNPFGFPGCSNIIVTTEMFVL